MLDLEFLFISCLFFFSFLKGCFFTVWTGKKNANSIRTATQRVYMSCSVSNNAVGSYFQATPDLFHLKLYHSLLLFLFLSVLQVDSS